ncbi:MAG: DUF1926 domain-containing protein [Firmicutes bacterium]|nr:DUF1926 domain-containing protein [Bacillota bacterium]
MTQENMPGPIKNEIYFVLALHQHQPVGNFQQVFENAYDHAYKPFLEVLVKYPGVKVSLHYSGVLLQWMERNKPEIFTLLQELIKRGQVEMMGGGFFEPILPIIPQEDQQGQITALSRYLEDKLGARARGLWLTERIWEPHLAASIAKAGLEYVVVDDAHFKELGYNDSDLTGYYKTEEEGYPLHIFPISEELRYLIPFEPPERTLDFFRSRLCSWDKKIIVLADDGEKFGVWPGTWQHVYSDGWLERFFTMLQENSSWLKTITFSEVLNKFAPKGLVYLPTAAYREMKEWSGGFWRNFLIRYPESNRMHKKMLAVRSIIQQMPEGKNKDDAMWELWQGQCNCAYWHGVFGGLYLNFLRSAVYSHLLKAEQIALEAQFKKSWVQVEEKDYDYDGFPEIVCRTKDLTLLLSPHKGASLWELSFRPKHFNLLDTLTRRPEKYHQDLKEDKVLQAKSKKVNTIHGGIKVKEEGLKDYLIYDPYPRGALMDHVLSSGVDLSSFARGKFREEADFLLKPYLYNWKKGRDKVTFIFERNSYWHTDKNENGHLIPVSLKKVIEVAIQKPSLYFRYTLKCREGQPVSFLFGVEFNFAFLAGDAPDRYYFVPGRQLQDTKLVSIAEDKEVESLGIRDDWRKLQVTFKFKQPANIWRFPVETVSQSEDGLE